MKILITGGAGYIGSILAPLLLQKGHDVTVIDNFLYNQSSLLEWCHDARFHIVRGDARNRTLMERIMRDAEVIIPLACLTGAPLCAKLPDEARQIIVDGANLLLELRRPEQKIIYPTTDSGYGIVRGQTCDENTALNPISLYGKYKVEAERAINSAGNSVILRLSTAFGVSPRMRLDLLVNDFVYRAVHDKFIVLFEGDVKRNFIHVRDIARAFSHAGDNFEAMKNETFNVGLDEANISKRELCEEIKKQVPQFYMVEAAVGEDEDKRNYIVSHKKLTATGFRPSITLQEGIAELLKAYEIVKRNQFSNV